MGARNFFVLFLDNRRHDKTADALENLRSFIFTKHFPRTYSLSLARRELTYMH